MDVISFSSVGILMQKRLQCSAACLVAVAVGVAAPVAEPVRRAEQAAAETPGPGPCSCRARAGSDEAAGRSGRGFQRAAAEGVAGEARRRKRAADARSLTIQHHPAACPFRFYWPAPVRVPPHPVPFCQRRRHRAANRVRTGRRPAMCTGRGRRHLPAARRVPACRRWSARSIGRAEHHPVPVVASSTGSCQRRALQSVHPSKSKCKSIGRMHALCS